MKLTAPKQITFWIAVAIAVLGIIAKFVLPGYGGWLALIAFVVLAAGNLVKGL